jgi:hypothetical protein
MSILTDLQKRADTNGDGKIDAKDLQDLQDQYKQYGDILGNLKGVADSNGDGKIDMNDIQGAMDKLDTLGKLGSIFGGGTAIKSAKKKKKVGST